MVYPINNGTLNWSLQSFNQQTIIFTKIRTNKGSEVQSQNHIFNFYYIQATDTVIYFNYIQATDTVIYFNYIQAT